MARGLIEPTPTTTQPAAAAAAAAPASPTPQATTPLVATPTDEPVAAVAAAMGPSVVQIRTQDGLGSGVVYDASGLILTNAHVVGDDKTVQVHLGDGNTVEGTVVGTDVPSDIGVVKVEGVDGLKAAPLATETPKVGSMAVALGSPFGLDQTVTAGVVSAVDRPVDNEQGVIVGMIQTDAPINPGNSGGALANKRAELIGINSQIYSEKGENNGIGFAIPVARAKDIADKLVNGESVSRAALGVQGKATTDGTPGAAVSQVTPGSGAAQAGLAVNDVITKVDGATVKDFEQLAAVVGNHSPGDRVSLEIQRAGKTMTLQVTLGARTN